MIEDPNPNPPPLARAKALHAARLGALASFVVCSVLGLTFVMMDDAHHEHEARALASDLGSAHLRLLSERVNASLSATYALGALVRQGRGEVPDFEATAQEMLQLYPGAASLQLAPDGVVRRVVPLAGNEAAIGHDLLRDPARTREAFLAVETRKLTLAGPFQLVQGGLGAVGRLPVFLPDAGSGERFWGFTSVLIRFPEVLAGAGLERIPERGYDFALWRRDPRSGEALVIEASSGGIPEDAVEVAMTVPNGQWLLSLKPRKGWRAASEIWTNRLVALLAAGLVASLAYGLLTKPIRLREEVERRTRELRDSEERFRTVVNTLPDLVWLKDPGGVYLSCNSRCEAFFGARAGQIVGKTDYDLVDRTLADSFRDNDRKAIEAGGPRSNEEWITFASDGHRELLQTIKTPVFDSLGRLIGVLGIGRDVSELRRLSDEYRASEARLVAAQRVARIGSWERDLERELVYWSDQVYAMFELEKDCRPGYETFLGLVHDEDREWVAGAYEELRRKGGRLHLQVRLRMADGRIKHVEMRADRLEGEGRGPRIVGTLQDVTDKVLAEERLRRQQAQSRAMLSAIPVGVAITDMQGRIVEFNEAALGLLMVEAAALQGRRLDQLGLSLRDHAGRVLTPERYPDALALRQRSPVQDVELELAGPAGVVEVAMSVAVVGRDGQGVVIALVNLAARRRAEAALREHTTRITALNQRFALAAEAAALGVWEFDLANQRFSWDEGMLRLHGLAAEQFDGSLAAWMECLHADDRARFAHALERARRGEDELDLDFRVPGARGETSYLRVCAKATRSEAGSVRGLTGVCIDMTTLKRSEQILIQERRRYRDLVDSTDGIVWQAEADSLRFTDVSRHAERLLGYPLAQWLEPDFWSGHVHPADAQRVGAHRAQLRSTQASDAIEYRMVGRDGRVVWLRDIVTVVAEHGVARWLRGVMVDITEQRRIAEALALSEERLSLAVEGAGLAMWDWDLATDRLQLGGAGLRMLGYRPGERDEGFAGWAALVHPDDLAMLRSKFAAHLEGREERVECECRLRHRDPGRWVWAHGLGQAAQRDAAGRAQRAAGILLDVTERRVAEERVRAALRDVERLSARNALLLSAAGEGIFGVDHTGRCIFINPVALELLGLQQGEALNREVGALFRHCHDDGVEYRPDECPILLTIGDGVRRQVEDVLVRRDGRQLAVRMTVTEMREGAERVGAEVVFQDVTARREMERELHRLATTDPLTGVLNRRQFLRRCEQELDRLRRFGQPVSLLMIDLDHFKQVNDTHGHAVGDEALRHLAALAGEQLRRTDEFARLGGEEFAFLLAGSDLNGAMEFAARFRQLVESRPARTNGGSIALTISIGAAQAAPGDGAADDLLRRADAALYRAKDGGRNRVEAGVSAA